jgi:hypothetical protein
MFVTDDGSCSLYTKHNSTKTSVVWEELQKQRLQSQNLSCVQVLMKMVYVAQELGMVN